MLMIITGKSASGKDTIKKELVKKDYEPVLSLTTRQPREGEKYGLDYIYTVNEYFESLLEQDKLYESRKAGNIYYGTLKSDLDMVKHNPEKNYIMIKDLEGAEDIIDYIGQKNVFVAYIDVSDDIRKKRASIRNDFSEEKWNERVESDNKQFTHENIDKVVDVIFYNNKDMDNLVKDIDETMSRIKANISVPKGRFRDTFDREL